MRTRASLGRVLGLLVPPVIISCAPSFDTSRTLPSRGSLGEELFGVVCDRLGGQSLHEDLTGASYQGICHRPFTDTVDQARLPPLVDGQPNWLTAMTDVNGLGQQYLWYNDALHKVRADDNVHLEPDGATRTATWTASTLSRVWAGQPPPPARPTVQQSPSGLIPAGDPVTIDVPQDGSG